MMPSPSSSIPPNWMIAQTFLSTIFPLPLSFLWIVISFPIYFVLTLLGLSANFRLENDNTNLSHKLFVVTGANCGIGRFTAAGLAKRGARVILACRSKQRGLAAQQNIREEIASVKRENFPHASKGSVEFMQLDLGDLDSVRAFANEINSLPRLDGLINNAGLGGGKKECGRTKQDLNEVFGVNFIGHFLLTTLLMEKLKSNPDGARIINLGSVMHRFCTYDFHGSAMGEDQAFSYANSKMAMILFTLELRRRLANTKIVAVAVNPGGVSSEIWRNIKGVSRWFLNIGMRTLFLDSNQGSATSLFAASRDIPDGYFYFTPYYVPRFLPGIIFELLGPFSGAHGCVPQVPKGTMEAKISLALWNMTQKLIDAPISPSDSKTAVAS